MTTTEQLQAARDKIADPRNWCQEYYAKDATGRSCSMHSSDAVAWCARGALGPLVDANIRAYDILSDASWFIKEEMPPNINDEGTHADVMHMYDVAIRMAGGST